MLRSNRLSYVAEWRAFSASLGGLSTLFLRNFLLRDQLLRRIPALCRWGKLDGVSVGLAAVDGALSSVASALNRYGQAPLAQGFTQGAWPCPGPVHCVVAMRWSIPPRVDISTLVERSLLGPPRERKRGRTQKPPGAGVPGGFRCCDGRLRR